MTGQRGWQGWMCCSPIQLTAPQRMRSLERPDSLGKHFHSSRRISFFLFSIVPLCCLPLSPLSIHVLRPPLHLGRGSCWMCSRCSLGKEGEKGPAEGPPGCGGTLAAAVGSDLPVLARGCGKEGATELVLEASGQPQACPTPGLMVGWQGWKLCPFPPLGHLFGTVKSAQHGRQENLYILPPKI